MKKKWEQPEGGWIGMKEAMRRDPERYAKPKRRLKDIPWHLRSMFDRYADQGRSNVMYDRGLVSKEDYWLLKNSWDRKQRKLRDREALVDSWKRRAAEKKMNELQICNMIHEEKKWHMAHKKIETLAWEILNECQANSDE